MILLEKRVHVPDQGQITVFKRPFGSYHRAPSYNPVPGERRIRWRFGRIYSVDPEKVPEPDQTSMPVCRNCAFYFAADQPECRIHPDAMDTLPDRWCGRWIHHTEFQHAFDRQETPHHMNVPPLPDAPVRRENGVSRLWAYDQEPA